MATYSFYAYSSSVLTYSASTGAFTLASTYDPQLHRILVTVTDDDIYFDGDQGAEELGEDVTQIATITRPDGTFVAQGRIYDEAFAAIEGPGTTEIWLDRIEIAGVHYGYFASEPLVPGQSYPVLYSEEVDNNLDGQGYDNRLYYGQMSSVPCFLSATRIDTARGTVPVDWLMPGDLVQTRDDGLQPILHVSRRYVPRSLAQENPAVAPIRIATTAGAVLSVSPQHRLLLAGPWCELFFAAPEVLCAARHLLGQPGVGPAPVGRGVVYLHLHLGRHHVLRAGGLWAESQLPAAPADQAARRCLTRPEARVLLAAALLSRLLPDPAPGKPQLSGRTASDGGLICGIRRTPCRSKPPRLTTMPWSPAPWPKSMPRGPA